MSDSIKSIADRMVDRTQSTPDFVAGALREAIVSGVIAPGSVVRQDLVAAEMAVSKIPVREALSRLEAEGLVRFQRNRGAEVTPVSIAEMRELFDMRRQLECLALERSIPLMTDADFVRARSVIDEARCSDEPSHLCRLNHDFHEALFAGAPDGPLRETIRRTMMLAERYIRLHLLMTGMMARTNTEHTELLRLARAGDVEAACAFMDRHLDKAVMRLSKHFEAEGFIHE
jgi:DNA-binding GntR family transcriptional regulator